MSAMPRSPDAKANKSESHDRHLGPPGRLVPATEGEMEEVEGEVNLWKRFLRWKRRDAYWEQSRATNLLQDAWGHLYRSYWWTASAREREALLPEQKEALDILHNLAHESLERQCEL